MLKASQEYVLRRKREKQEAAAKSPDTTNVYGQPVSHSNNSAKQGDSSQNSAAGNESSSDFLSVTSNFTAQHAELADELRA